MVRSDRLGVTSVIRDLGLCPGLYETMIHFFRSTSWSLDNLRLTWYKVVRKNAPICREQGYTILIGDGVKQNKEARFMPGVKKLFQESEDSSKPQYIYGHMFGGLGVLIGNETKKFCLPISIRLHDGLQFLESWKKTPGIAASHVIQMVEDGFRAVQTFGNSILLLDRYFLSVPALSRLAELNAGNDINCMEIVTKAKLNCVAYGEPKRKNGRGRPAKKGEKVLLRNLFTDSDTLFQKATLNLYGKPTEVQYHCVDLLWGQGLYRKLRFVLVKYGKSESILVSTCLDLAPDKIICLYSYRFRIEGCFREMKQHIGGFCYHFWTKSMPKLNRFRKKNTPDPLLTVTDEKQRCSIRAAIRAVEAFVMLSCIAMGTLQMLALNFAGTLDSRTFRYLRTPLPDVVSEATVMCFLRKNIFRLMALHPDLLITRFILSKSDPSVLDSAA